MDSDHDEAHLQDGGMVMPHAERSGFLSLTQKLRSSSTDLPSQFIFSLLVSSGLVMVAMVDWGIKLMYFSCNNRHSSPRVNRPEKIIDPISASIAPMPGLLGMDTSPLPGNFFLFGLTVGFLLGVVFYHLPSIITRNPKTYMKKHDEPGLNCTESPLSGPLLGWGSKCSQRRG